MSYNYPHYIKKNGRYKDFEKAKQFYSKYEAEKFLRDKRGEFWEGVEITRQ